MAHTDLQFENAVGELETTLLENADAVRRRISPTLEIESRAQLGQFMTPAVVARFMASLFSKPKESSISLLDAGAGVGGLTAAFIERCVRDRAAGRTAVTAYEIDNRLRSELAGALAGYQAAVKNLSVEIHAADFIEEAVNSIQFKTGQRFTHAILNPPYRKINTDSGHRKLLRLVGVETVNLYSAFVALAIKLMKPGGEIVAIIPRSFCNGPYYRPFREQLLQDTAIRQIHLFDSRTSAFSDDAVLQENIIIRLVVGRKQGPVAVSTSSDKTLGDLVSHRHPFTVIVAQNDSERFIHIPAGQQEPARHLLPQSEGNLRATGLEVSTGPVVDFRLKKFLLPMPRGECAPLIYANHFSQGELVWPRTKSKKANAIQATPETDKWLYPNDGFYTVLRRFSSKEERRRVVAYVVAPNKFGPATQIGFENHLNVFHCGRKGLDADVAHGLALYLNSTAVDNYFRTFSGHTQVNATDLRNLQYPSLERLRELGEWAKRQGRLSQEAIDKHISPHA